MKSRSLCNLHPSVCIPGTHHRNGEEILEIDVVPESHDVGGEPEVCEESEHMCFDR